MSGLARKLTNNKTNLPLAPYLTGPEQRELSKLKAELDGGYGGSERPMLETTLRRVVPKCGRFITRAVQSAMTDRFGAEAKPDSVPVDFFLDFPDLTVLWVRVDPNTHEFKIKYGSHF